VYIFFPGVGYMVVKYSLNMKDKPLVIVYRMKELTLIWRSFSD